jgi:hypothetical protein
LKIKNGLLCRAVKFELILGAVEAPFVLFWQIASDVRAIKHPDNSLVDSSFFWF